MGSEMCIRDRKMRAKSSSAKKPAEQVVKDIRRATRRHFSAEDKIRIVLDGLRGDDSNSHSPIASSNFILGRVIDRHSSSSRPIMIASRQTPSIR